MSSVTNQRYTRKQSARERPTICPICYEDVVTHFPRHLSRHHPKDPEVKRMLSLKPNSKERLEIVSAFRKRGYFILKTEKDISYPVRSSKDSDTDHVVCMFCLGLYNKKMLYRHVKVVKVNLMMLLTPARIV
ncbi:hypothetical protein NQ314_010492 [Rhamnusium bicolor]|uniref:Uncharacterized protein n=1 Tax=Rhamnusium bicolor TaxID=1586634 RepID=A0AAV8XT83_9CUCU|nr:hypothetical protein NQ314_010492 [Rhamnusium bicolor]